MVQKIEWDGEWIATLIESASGSYLAPPIVFDGDGNVIMGREVLAAIVESGVTVECPTLRDYAAADLAGLEQKLARIAERLDIPSRSGRSENGPWSALTSDCVGYSCRLVSNEASR